MYGAGQLAPSLSERYLATGLIVEETLSVRCAG